MVVLASGCGSSAAPQSSAAALFRVHCGACHSLTGHDSPRYQGGDLLHLRIGPQAMLQFTREMPVVRSPLTGAQARAVSRYLLALERR